MAESSKTPELVRLRERYEHLKGLRTGHESMMEDARRYVTPNMTGGFRSSPSRHTPDDDPSKEIYDHTAVWANQMFANGMTSYMIPQSQRWAYLKPEGRPSSELSDRELLFLERLSDKINHLFSVPDSGFYTAGHEAFQSVGSFGTGAVRVDRSGRVPKFRSAPLADTFFDTDDDSRVDTVFFRKFLSPKAVFQRFPRVLSDVPKFDINARNAKHEIVYAVEPSDDPRARPGGRIGPERPFRVSYFSPDLEAVLETGQKSYFPFVIPRWAVLAGEVYGRGPATTCMAQIRVLNKMVAELMTSAEQANAPPLVAEEDSILLPINYGSRQVLYHEAGTNPPQPLVSGSDPGLTLELLRDYRDQITRSFFVDQIIREQKRERQSIVEIQDERGQMLQQLGPAFARMEVEFAGPVIEQMVEHLAETGDPLFEEVPGSLEDSELEIIYTSPAAQAQFSSDISNIAGFVQDISPFLQNDPSLLENFDMNELFDTLARKRGVPRRVLRSSEDVEEARRERQQTEELRQAGEQAPQISGALKDVADARATDPEGVGRLLNIGR